MYKNITVKRPLKSPNKVNVMEWHITIKMSEIELYGAIYILRSVTLGLEKWLTG